MEDLELTNVQMEIITISPTLQWINGDKGKEVFPGALRWDLFRFTQDLQAKFNLQKYEKLREETLEKLADKYEGDVMIPGKEGPVVVHKKGDAIVTDLGGGKKAYSFKNRMDELVSEIEALEGRKTTFAGITKIRIPKDIVEKHLSVNDMMILSMFADLESPKDEKEAAKNE